MMNKSLFYLLIITLMLAFGLLSGCRKKVVVPVEDSDSKVKIHFSHINSDTSTFDTINNILIFDTLIYTNTASNRYLVNEIQYFISYVTLYKSDGSVILADQWDPIHYVDTDIPDTWQWLIGDEFTSGNYDSLSLTFGIPEEQNISFMYVNPPERDMFWPEYLGGGYHSLKLNGKWLEIGQTIQTTPFDFHIGRGQIYESYPDSIIEFVPNDFKVTILRSGFSLIDGVITEIHLNMDIGKWFNNPHIFDLDVWGGYIMQNQDAMQIAKENGDNVFTTRLSGDLIYLLK